MSAWRPAARGCAQAVRITLAHFDGLGVHYLCCKLFGIKPSVEHELRYHPHQRITQYGSIHAKQSHSALCPSRVPGQSGVAQRMSMWVHRPEKNSVITGFNAFDASLLHHAGPAISPFLRFSVGSMAAAPASSPNQIQV